MEGANTCSPLSQVNHNRMMGKINESVVNWNLPRMDEGLELSKEALDLLTHTQGSPPVIHDCNNNLEVHIIQV